MMPSVNRNVRPEPVKRIAALVAMPFIHGVPLLMAVGARLPQRHHWLQKGLVHYLEEELGHEEWILSDIDAAGGDAARVRRGSPGVETDAMVAYAYDTDVWVNFKLFGGIGLMILFVIGQAVMLAPHIKEKETE